MHWFFVTFSTVCYILAQSVQKTGINKKNQWKHPAFSSLPDQMSCVISSYFKYPQSSSHHIFLLHLTLYFLLWTTADFHGWYSLIMRNYNLCKMAQHKKHLRRRVIPIFTLLLYSLYFLNEGEKKRRGWKEESARKRRGTSVRV